MEWPVASRIRTILNPDELSDEQSYLPVEPIIYNFTNSRADVFEINGSIRVHGISSTIFISSSQENNLSSWIIQPYARKGDTMALGRVTNFKIEYETPNGSPNCHQIINIPSIIFSIGGYAGNYFHAFTDVLLPLFLTSHQFNQRVVFLVTNKYPGWIPKYKVILDKLSMYPIHDIDKEDKTLCFSRIIIGLKANEEFTTDSSESTNLSMRNFTKFLRRAFALKRDSINNCFKSCAIKQRPRVLVIRRRKARHIMNQGGLAEMAQSLGFEVILKQFMWNVSIVAQLVNSFDVLVGVHGAGLTNMVFLPENAIVIQIIPFGLDIFAKTCYEKPARSMNLRYLEYKASLNESSLLQNHTLDVKIFEDPRAVYRKGFDGFRTMYLDNQDLYLDLGRFRETLLTASKILGI
ncbi:protein O-GlcNAc transferase [Handroanthus impetiginosus]|uniref:Protein O-GlcNAc transferase n=1 Tax=Handroanthus impetiginosus TaxID=429701 RepID=A0A2G9I0I7_9LAMI|nr:protein O-GlcNAc transferase [Handroanthus impetiginosus]